MTTDMILAAIDQQLALLRQAKALLIGDAAPATAAKRRGRPKGSKNALIEAKIAVSRALPKPTLSAAGKARIAIAQKARWAAVKKSTAPVKATAKKTPAKSAS